MSTDYLIKIDESLERMEELKPSFKDDIEENVLLIELINVGRSLKKYIEKYAKPTDPSNILDDLERRMTIVENDVTGLETVTSDMSSDLTNIDSDTTLLTASDIEINSDISTLKAKDLEIENELNGKYDSIEVDIEGLQANDPIIRSSFNAAVSSIETDIATTEARLAGIDPGDISGNIAALKAEDTVIAQLVVDNDTMVRGEIARLKTEVVKTDNLDSDITSLQNEDTRVKSEIATNKSDADTAIAALQQKDVSIKSDIVAAENRLSEIPDSFPKTSETSEAGKMPVGLSTGFIADGWIDPAIVS